MGTERITEIIKEMLQKMNISFESIELTIDAKANYLFSIHTKEKDLLIGLKGEVFIAFSHLIKRIGEKVLGEGDFVSVDVNNYQAEMLLKLKQKAFLYAERARSFKTSVPMDPMSSYERMIVHSLFTESKDVTTESKGLGNLRHVVIKYKENSIL